MARWNPWQQLDQSAVELRFGALDRERGRWTRGSERDEIVLDPSMDRRSRREVLAHELVHAERGIGWPSATAATMELEEERVWRIALVRLAPPAEVAAFVLARSTVGPVTIDDVAEEFDLSPRAAARTVALMVATGRFPLPQDDA